MKSEQSRDDGLPMGWLDANTPTCRIKRIRKREGRCYELAMRGCLQAPEWELVHGESNGHSGAGTIGHAWLEFDGEVYCPVLDKTMPIGDFLRILGARAHARYSSEDAICLMLIYGLPRYCKTILRMFRTNPAATIYPAYCAARRLRP